MELSLTIQSEFLYLFLPFLREGVALRGTMGCSIEVFLCEQLDVDVDYVQNRIQTIFLNGKAVDDLTATILPDGATLTLSAAMPGLAGATLRRGGRLASMREGISCIEQTESTTLSEGQITLKLFNLISKELAPKVLKKGIWIKGTTLCDHLGSQSDRFWTGCLSAELDHKAIDPIKLAKLDLTEEQVFLRVLEA